jgi:hypothetical protein
MSEGAVAAPPVRQRAKRSPSLGVASKSITIDIPNDMYSKFEASAKKEILPLKLYLVRELAGLNAKPAPAPTLFPGTGAE